MKKLIVTTTDDKFAPGCAVLLYSLQKNMKDFHECDVKIFYTSLSQSNKDMIKSVCPKVTIQEPEDFDYCKGIKTLYGEDNQDTYLCLESFKQSEYDRVAYIDTDILCISDISYIFSDKLDYGMMACAGTKALNEREKYHPHGFSKFNAGFMVIGKENLAKNRTYNKLINIVKEASTTKSNDEYKILGKKAPTFNDQDAIKIFFRNNPVFILPDWYNFKHFGHGPSKKDFKRTDKNFRVHLDDIRLIHYSGKRKPWANITDRSTPSDDGRIAGVYDVCSMADPKEMNKSLAIHMWHEYYEECFGERCENDWYLHDREDRW